MKKTKILGVMTSGGDAPGMNAAIRAIVRAAIGSGFRVVGFNHGYEGIDGGAVGIAEQLKKLSQNEYRVVILGYIQRGGHPSAKDRCLATRLGFRAVQAILNGESGKMAGETGGKPVLVPFHIAVKGKRHVDRFYGQMMKFLNL